MTRAEANELVEKHYPLFWIGIQYKREEAIERLMERELSDYFSATPSNDAQHGITSPKRWLDGIMHNASFNDKDEEIMDDITDLIRRDLSTHDLPTEAQINVEQAILLKIAEKLQLSRL